MMKNKILFLMLSMTILIANDSTNIHVVEDEMTHLLKEQIK